MRIRNSNSVAALESRPIPGVPPVGVSAPGAGKFSTFLVAAYAFIVASRILDLSSIAKLHIPLMIFIALALFTLGMISQRGIHGFLDNKASLCFAAVTLWVILAFPLSEWRQVSWPLVESTIQGLVIFSAVVLVASTPENWRKIAAGFAYATVTAGILGVFISRSVGGRITMGRGSLADPNEFALSLTIGLPFLLYTAAVSKGFKRIALYASSAVVLYGFARTGSRGGMLALLAMLVVLFVFAKSGQKMLIAAACMAGLAVGAVVLPGYIKARFTTFFAVHDQQLSTYAENRLDSDVSSTEARKAILIQSLQITAAHPLLGVGPGVFPTVARHERVAQGKYGGGNLVTHNTYTEYSSETGIPGFLFWVGTLYFCIKYTRQVYRSAADDENLAAAARNALAAIMALAVGSFFLALAYGLKIPVLLGLTVALRNVAEGRRASPRGSEAHSNAPILSAVAQPALVAQPAISGVAASGRLPQRKPRRFDLSGRPRNRY